jgi:hypothetical protein
MSPKKDVITRSNFIKPGAKAKGIYALPFPSTILK